MREIFLSNLLNNFFPLGKCQKGPFHTWNVWHLGEEENRKRRIQYFFEQFTYLGIKLTFRRISIVSDLRSSMNFHSEVISWRPPAIKIAQRIFMSRHVRRPPLRPTANRCAKFQFNVSSIELRAGADETFQIEYYGNVAFLGSDKPSPSSHFSRFMKSFRQGWKYFCTPLPNFSEAHTFILLTSTWIS